MENIQKGISFIKDICDRDDLEFCFIGGEPLLYWDEVKLSVDCILASFPKAKFVVVTNGTLFTDAICEYLFEKNFYTIVSVDGNEERHNKARTLKSDQSGSFEMVDNGLGLLKKYNIKYAICVTIDTHNCNFFVDDVEWLVEKYQPDDLHVNGILHDAERNSSTAANFAQGLTTLFDRFNTKKKPLPKQVKRWFLPFISLSEKMHFDCAAFGQKIVMSPDGYHVCEGFASKGEAVPLSKVKYLVNTWANYSDNNYRSQTPNPISFIHTVETKTLFEKTGLE